MTLYLKAVSLILVIVSTLYEVAALKIQELDATSAVLIPKVLISIVSSFS